MFKYLTAYKHKMVTKTITVTEEAYNALKALKAQRESFSKTIIRVSKRKPLSSFYGILGRESGGKFEKNILNFRKKHAELYKSRIKRIAEEMKSR